MSHSLFIAEGEARYSAAFWDLFEEMREYAERFNLTFKEQRRRATLRYLLALAFLLVFCLLGRICDVFEGLFFSAVSACKAVTVYLRALILHFSRVIAALLNSSSPLSTVSEFAPVSA
jgi:hypothetical protein